MNNSNKLTNIIIIFSILSGLLASSGFTLKALCVLSNDAYSLNSNIIFSGYFLGFFSNLILLTKIRSNNNIITLSFITPNFYFTLLINIIIGLTSFYCFYYLNLIAGVAHLRLLLFYYHDSTVYFYISLFSGFIQGLIFSIFASGKKVFISNTKTEFYTIILFLLPFFILGYYFY